MDRVNGADWIDIGSGRRGFRGRNALAGVRGTEVTAPWLNAFQEELLAIIEQAGVVPDVATWTQLIQALRRGAIEYVTLGGTASALTATFTPANLVLRDGMRIWCKVPLKHADGATLNLDGLGAKPILTQRGNAIKRGDLPETGRGLLVYNADLAAWLIAGIAYSETPIFLTAAMTVYVRPDGNDANDGSANTAASAFQTLQAAVNYARRVSGSGYAVTVQVAAGSYAPVVIRGLSVTLAIRGDLATPTNVTIGGTVAGSATLLADGVQVEVAGCYISNTANYGVVAAGGGTLRLTNMSWGTASNACINADRNGTIIMGGTQKMLPASHAACISATSGGTITIDGNNPPALDSADYVNVSSAFMLSAGGYVDWAGGSFTNKSNVIGKRYQCQNGGIIASYGGGATLFPGTLAGDATAGWYY